MKNALSVRALLLLLILTFVPPPVAAQDVPEGSPEAIAEFAEGMKLYVAQNYQEAVDRFMRAHQLDNTFVVSLFMASLVQGNLSNGAEARRLLDIVWEHRDQLSPYYRGRLDTQMALRRGDQVGALHYARATAEAAPGTKALYNLAYVSNRLLRPMESLEALDGLDPTAEPMRGWYSYHAVRAGALHQVERFREELTVAQHAWQEFGRQGSLNIQARALGALGDRDGLDFLWDECMAVEPAGPAYTPGHLMMVAGSEAMVHGHPDLADELFQDAADWWDGQEVFDPTVAVRNLHSFALYASGRVDEAADMVDGILEELPQNAWYHSAAGVLAAARGDQERLAEEEAWLAAPRESVAIYWLNTYRAYLAAAQGNAAETLALLQSAVDDGLAYQIWWHRHPAFYPVMEDEAFRAFITPIR